MPGIGTKAGMNSPDGSGTPQCRRHAEYSVQRDRC